MKIEYKIEKNNIGKSINYILTNELNISTRLLNKLIKHKKILLNKHICNTKNTVNLGDIIEVKFDISENNSNITPTKMELDIIYEDEWFLVINKPYGIPIHPSRLHYADSLSNGIKFYFDSIGLSKKIRPVNRLDLDTSGLVIFAKCEYIQECFIRQMITTDFKKEYLCLVEGYLKQKIGTINLPISRKKGSIIERCINNEHGQPSITHYEVLKEFCNYSLVNCKLETGRTHQIRVHLSHIGYPIVGDYIYSNGKNEFGVIGQCLHAKFLEFVHPITNKEMQLEAPIPEYFQEIINRLEEN